MTTTFDEKKSKWHTFLEENPVIKGKLENFVTTISQFPDSPPTFFKELASLYFTQSTYLKNIENLVKTLNIFDINSSTNLSLSEEELDLALNTDADLKKYIVDGVTRGFSSQLTKYHMSLKTYSKTSEGFVLFFQSEEYDFSLTIGLNPTEILLIFILEQEDIGAQVTQESVPYVKQELVQTVNSMLKKVDISSAPSDPVSESIYAQYKANNTSYNVNYFPPPPSPLQPAYYGSNAYESKKSPVEMELNKILETSGKDFNCPQITGGSNPKKVHYNPFNKYCILVKSQSIGQSAIEVLASHIHRAMGMYAPDMRSVGTSLFSPLLSNDYQQATTTDIESIIKSTEDKFNPLKQQIVDLFIVSCWIANWDVWGMHGDNTLITKKGKKSTLACIDLGGAFMFSAMGAYKETKGWNPVWFPHDFEHVVKAMEKQMVDMLNPQMGAGKYFQYLATYKHPKIKSSGTGTNIQSTKLVKTGTSKSNFKGILQQGSKLHKMANNTCNRALMLMHPDYDYISLLIQWCGIASTKTTMSHIEQYFKKHHSIHSDKQTNMNQVIRDWLFYRILAIKTLLNS